MRNEYLSDGKKGKRRVKQQYQRVYDRWNKHSNDIGTFVFDPFKAKIENMRADRRKNERKIYKRHLAQRFREIDLNGDPKTDRR